MTKTFFIADLHFGHKNCLIYDKRPFSNIEEHDQTLIERWNSTVEANDTVWILGDFSWYPVPKTISIFSQLNGIKRLVIGNHDRKLLKDKGVRSLFDETVDYKEIRLGEKNGMVLCHYPIPFFNHQLHGWYHLYGHIHNNHDWTVMESIKEEAEAYYNKPCNMYNVGCMMPYMDYTPRTLEDIIASSNSILKDSGRIL